MRASIVAVVLLAVVTRTASMLRMGAWERPLDDQPTEEVILAQSLADGVGYIMPYHENRHYPDRTPSAHSPPGYPFMLAVLIRATHVFAVDEIVAYRGMLLVGILASAVGVALISVAAGGLFGSPAFWGCGLVGSLWPLSTFCSVVLWDTPFVMLAIAWGIWIAVRPGKPGWGRGLFTGLLWGGFTLVNPLVMPFLAAAIFLSTLRRTGGRRVGVGLMPLVLGWLIAVLPWQIRNVQVLGRLIPIRNNLGLELWIGNLPESDGTSEGAGQWHPMNNRHERKQIVAMGEDAYMRDRGARAIERIRSHPDEFLALTWQRVRLYWLGDLRDLKRESVGDSRERALPALAKAIMNLALLGVAVRGWFCRGAASFRWLFLFGLLYLPMLYYLTHVSPFYRAAVTPILFCLGGGGAACVLGRMDGHVRDQRLVRLLVSDLRAKARWVYGSEAASARVKALLTDGTLAMILYRLMQASHRARLAPLAMLFNKLNAVLGQCIIGRGADFGPEFVLVHSQGVVINTGVRGGRGVVIEHQVTIGAQERQVPVIGDGVFIGAGARIIGPVTVGAGAKVGANAVVVHDVPAGATAVGVPARVVAGSGA